MVTSLNSMNSRAGWVMCQVKRPTKTRATKVPISLSQRITVSGMTWSISSMVMCWSRRKTSGMARKATAASRNSMIS